MLGKDFGLGAAQPYYFRFIPNAIQAVGDKPDQRLSFKFVVFKGVQKFDECKNLVLAEFDGNNLKLDDVQLNFYLPNYLPNRKVQFIVKILLTDGSSQNQVGSVIIDTGKVITGFKESKINLIAQNTSLSEDLKIDYVLYVDKNKNNLESAVKNNKGDSSAVRKENSVDVDTRKSSGIKNLARSVDTQELNQQPVKKQSFVRKPDLTRSVDPRTQSQQASQSVHQKSARKQVSQTSSKKKEAYTSHKKEETSSKKSGAKDAVKKMKVGSDRQYSINVPISKSTVGIHYQTSELKSSRHQYEADKQKQKAQKQNEHDPKYIIKVAVFIILSLFFIYNAMTPTKRYNSKKVSRR